MTIGLPGLKASYPERQALYPISVRHNKCSPTASFRFPVTRDTLAFGYKIPAITALLGLGDVSPHLIDLLHARHTFISTLRVVLYESSHLSARNKS